MAKYDYTIRYGKKMVPVYRVHGTPLTGVTPIPESRFTGRTNELFAYTIDVEVLGGDFLEAFTVGDNSNVVATDSMKNFVIRQALEYEGATLEGFLAFLGRGFISTYEQLKSLRLTGREIPFQAAPVPTADGVFVESAVLFDRLNDDYATATLQINAGGGGVEIVDHRSGLVGLRLMKTTGSSFTSFVRDGYTTLPDRRDRPLTITLDAQWSYSDIDDLLGPSAATYVPSEQVRDLIRAVFHGFVSESIQHLVHEFAMRLLDRFPQLAEVNFRAENRTPDPFGESTTDPRARVYSDPFSAYGEIRLEVHRA